MSDLITDAKVAPEVVLGHTSRALIELLLAIRGFLLKILAQALGRESKTVTKPNSCAKTDWP